MDKVLRPGTKNRIRKTLRLENPNIVSLIFEVCNEATGKLFEGLSARNWEGLESRGCSIDTMDEFIAAFAQYGRNKKLDTILSIQDFIDGPPVASVTAALKQSTSPNGEPRVDEELPATELSADIQPMKGAKFVFGSSASANERADLDKQKVTENERVDENGTTEEDTNLNARYIPKLTLRNKHEVIRQWVTVGICSIFGGSFFAYALSVVSMQGQATPRKPAIKPLGSSVDAVAIAKRPTENSVTEPANGTAAAASVSCRLKLVRSLNPLDFDNAHHRFSQAKPLFTRALDPQLSDTGTETVPKQHLAVLSRIRILITAGNSLSYYIDDEPKGVANRVPSHVNATHCGDGELYLAIISTPPFPMNTRYLLLSETGRSTRKFTIPDLLVNNASTISIAALLCHPSGPLTETISLTFEYENGAENDSTTAP